jgi:two-component system sensor histidine kinase KdpD
MLEMSTGLRDARQALNRGVIQSAAVADAPAYSLFGPLIASLTLVGLTTAIIWYLEVSLALDPLIFIYFIPTSYIALRYGTNAAMMATIMSCIAAAYFLYPPEFSFAVGNVLEFMQIAFFILLAMLASQVVSGFVKDSKVEPRRARPEVYELTAFRSRLARLFERPRSRN